MQEPAMPGTVACWELGSQLVQTLQQQQHKSQDHHEAESQEEEDRGTVTLDGQACCVLPCHVPVLWALRALSPPFSEEARGTHFSCVPTSQMQLENIP